ncbi:hypothetical protein [Bradyrhizobium sp. AC87j1]|uniref:hypothetical protein n=1 Tax=Bradyrhizobium sp. AC87j1 TaxID=2055894 RepID=UPI0011B08AF8|nr:hypothetical protein [Bradyrhizobium sp. AC87j1]
MRIENLRKNLKQRFKIGSCEITFREPSSQPRRKMLQRDKALQGVTKETTLETATLWQRRNTVSGCQTLRMSIHKRIFSSIVDAGRSR